MYSGKEKLQAGLRVLQDGCDEQDILALALIRIHGAAEDYLRETLANKLPFDQTARIKNPRETQWQELIELAKKHLGISEEIGRQLIQANYFRQSIAHGGAYVESREKVEAYATLVRTLYKMEVTPLGRPPVRVRSRKVPGCSPVGWSLLVVIVILALIALSLVGYALFYMPAS